MTEEQQGKLEALEGMLLAHTSLFAAVLGVLKNRGGLTPDDMNAIFDNALLGVENSSGVTDEVERGARLYLEALAGAGGD